MCLPLPIIGIALSVAAGFAQAAITGQMASQQAKIEQEQLRIEMENERIKGMGDTNDRLEEFRRAEATNRAALSITGTTNLSYEQGVAPSNKSTVARDVQTLDYNAQQQVGRKKYEIAVAGWKAKATKRSAFMEAGTNALGKIGAGFSDGSFSRTGPTG